MAEATKSTRTVTTTEESFTLTLAPAEFDWLKGVVGNTVSVNGDPGERVWAAMKSPAAVETGTYTHKGVTYDLKAEYLDTSHDVWEFTGERDSAGVPLMSCAIGGDTYENWPLTRVADHYRTLRKI
ncbi:phiSA1p31-related protein [Streptomyces sp. NBC_01571]|uniref:phiSA1p31-related protein n=1 Tax=Streptomyces sp. NBC_01571 TaxID=2975883 RepID=UPI002251B5C1|nr:phiSA1p31-related protein [Streptomyces sp. NBC_01571]MCX4572307.1 phiSA1p31-related protein [Streptomyces sp. NBC_01571]